MGGVDAEIPRVRAEMVQVRAKMRQVRAKPYFPSKPPPTSRDIRITEWLKKH